MINSISSTPSSTVIVPNILVHGHSERFCSYSHFHSNNLKHLLNVDWSGSLVKLRFLQANEFDPLGTHV